MKNKTKKQNYNYLQLIKPKKITKTLNDSTTYTCNFFTRDEAIIIKDYIDELAETKIVQKQIQDDYGSCIMGEGISVYYKPTNRHKPYKILIFRNQWTQTSQSKALKKIIKIIEKNNPRLKNCFKYESGIMH